MASNWLPFMWITLILVYFFGPQQREADMKHNLVVGYIFGIVLMSLRFHGRAPKLCWLNLLFIKDLRVVLRVIPCVPCVLEGVTLFVFTIKWANFLTIPIACHFRDFSTLFHTYFPPNRFELLSMEVLCPEAVNYLALEYLFSYNFILLCCAALIGIKRIKKYLFFSIRHVQR